MVARGRLALLLAMTLGAGGITAACVSSRTKTEESAEKPTEITILMQDGGNPYAQNLKDGDIYIKEMSRLFSQYTGKSYSIRFEMISSSIYDKQLAIRFASGDIPDVMWTPRFDSPTHPKAAEDGLFLRLNDLIDKYGPNLKKNIPESAWNDPRVSKDGNIYGIPKMAALPNTAVILYRKDWLRKLGMQEPQTLDDYLAFFDAVKREDVNGNGDPNDEIPFAMRKGLAFSEAFFGYFGAHPEAWQFRNGEFVPNLIVPEMKDAVRFYKLLYDRGYVNRDSMFTMKDNDWGNLIYSGKVAMWYHSVQDLTSGGQLNQFADPNAEVGVLPGPKNSQGKVTLVPERSGVNNVYVISSKAEHPEDIIKFFNWVQSDDPEKNNFFAYGIKGYNYTETQGIIRWDPNAQANQANGASTFYQAMINPAGDTRLSPLVVSQGPYAELVKTGIEYTKINSFKDDSMYMPLPDALKTRPELGFRDGSLFIDMFVKVVTGREPLDTAFDKFVSDWRRQGGEQAIQDATQWYLRTLKKP